MSPPPGADGDGRLGTFEFELPPPCRLDPLTPTRWGEPGCNVGEWCQNEEPPAGLGVRHNESRSPPVRISHDEALPPEDEEIEVELSRPPPRAGATAESPLDGLQAIEEIEGGFHRRQAAADAEADGSVQEGRLVGDADGPCSVESRGRDDADAGLGPDGLDRGLHEPPGVASIRADADVHTPSVVGSGWRPTSHRLPEQRSVPGVRGATIGR